jgi:orotidine-5'-phosphate decarboxylase
MLPQERIIPALDFMHHEEVETCITQLHNAKTIKIDYAWKLIPDYPNIDFFVDEKYFDIPQTVARKVKRLTEFSNIKMCTVHAEKGIMAAAVKAAKDSNLKIFSVILLTSHGGSELKDFYNWNWQGNTTDFVLPRLEWALKAGVHGTICSAWEVAEIRKNVPDDFLIIVPGTRTDSGGIGSHDHKRSGSSRKAIEDGATHLVVGREIIDDPDPAAAFDRKVKDIS